MADNTSQVRTGEETLAQGVKLVDTAQQTLVGKVSQLRGTIETVQASWQGQGATAFKTAADQWDREATDIFNALQALRDALEGTSTVLSSTEQDVAAEIQKLMAAQQN